ncbi:plasmid mobilization relaxosome protein MobC [Roseovarius sp. MMSF_3281]|uniref:plasmid mobilization protein n=1 Tax=Roseovarius sp. MMSF_3281 TaxID=3046694 RepID=UPI00273DAFE2|nr:plasmid mobilization relaxosome protein MobC [Roseovarius sp. MMSF_3281]
MSTRPHQIKFRASDAEKERFQDAAREHRMRDAEYIRFRLFGEGEGRKLPSRDLLLRSLKISNGIGNNLNQIAKSVNEARLEYGHKLDGEQVMSIETRLRKLQKEHAELKELIREAL